MAKISLRLDRVTVVGTFKLTLGELEPLFREQGWQIGLPGRQDIPDFELHHVTGSVDEIKAVVLKNPYQATWRLDTSNHLNQAEKRSVSRILLLMAGKHLSRIDVAFDFINCKYPGMRHRLLHPNISSSAIWGQTDIFGRGHGLETLYLGRRKSLSQARYYDKKVEQIAARKELPADLKSWERLELQLRGSHIEQWRERCYQLLNCFKMPDYAVLEGTQRLIMQALIEHPENWKELSDRTKTKYRKLIRANSGFNTEYADAAKRVFDQQVENLDQEVQDFLIAFHVE